MIAPTHSLRWAGPLLVIALAGLFAVGSYAGGTGIFPLKIAGSGHHLEDQQGRPFLIHGDAAWGMMAMLTREEMETYLEQRRRQGFNAFIMMLICSHPSLHDGATTNRYGEAPFRGTNDFSQPNEAYFQLADWVIRRAADKNLLVLLAPAYVGYGEKDAWQTQMVANGIAKCRAYGDFLGARYRSAPNILWIEYGDNGDPAYRPYVRAIALGIKKHAPDQLQTAKLWPEQSSRDLLEGEAWLNVNATYAYGSLWNYKRKVYDKCLEDYERAPAMPAFLIESTYENEHDSTTQWVRRQAYGALLSGAAGQCMGNYPIWAFTNGWQAALDGPASRSMVHLKHLFDSRPWNLLVPDRDHQVVTAGYGIWKSNEYVVAARSRDGSTAMAYLPTGHAVRVNLGCVTGTQARVWWFDPRTGDAVEVGEFRARGTKLLAPPTSDDWVLVIDGGEGRLPAPGAVAR